MSIHQKMIDSFEKDVSVVNEKIFVPVVVKNNLYTKQYKSYVLFVLLVVVLCYLLLNNVDKGKRVVEVYSEFIDLHDVLLNKFADSQFDKADVLSVSPKDVANILGDKESDINGNKVIIYEIYSEDENQKKIDKWLLEADILFRMDRLTSPEFDNAYERYRTVIRFDKKNKRAVEGIKKIVDRYLYLADLVVSKKEYYKVPALLKSAVDVGGEYFDMSAAINKYSPYLNSGNMFVDLSDSAADTDNTEQLSDHKYKSIVEVDNEIFQVAFRQLSVNDSRGAMRILNFYESLGTQWGRSQDLLLQLLLADKNLQAAEALIAHYPQLDVVDFSEKAAKIIVARGDALGALRLLQSHVADMDAHPEYYALMAALHYKLEEYNQAILLYKKLLKIDVENSRYWLGLAVSLAAIKSEKSIDAFRFVHKLSGENSLVKKYLDQRFMGG